MYFKELEDYQGHHTILVWKRTTHQCSIHHNLYPVRMQSAYKAELDRLMQENIITEVNQHTE